jgi:hypothetical protein
LDLILLADRYTTASCSTSLTGLRVRVVGKVDAFAAPIV